MITRPDLRLLTLTGPGGSGKTRLAIEIAMRVAEVLEDGAWFVDLAPVQEARLVPSAIARALGLRDLGATPIEDELKQHIGSRQLLLVLDNFERLLGAAPFVADLLAACPRLEILTTSREPLRVRGEYEQPVPPLSFAWTVFRWPWSWLPRESKCCLRKPCLAAWGRVFDLLVDGPRDAPSRHKTLREYALEQLQSHGEELTARKKHAEYFAALAERAEPQLVRLEQAEWLARLEAEFSNFQVALSWATTDAGNPSLAVRIAGALWRFWWYRSHIGEGRRWLETVTVLEHREPPRAYAAALIGAGVLARDQGDIVQAVKHFEHALATAREFSDTPSAALALSGLSGSALQQGDFERCVQLSQAARVEYESVGDRRGIANSLQDVAQALIGMGDFEHAEAVVRSSIELLRELEDPISMAACLETLGDVAHAQKAFVDARRWYLESIAIYERTADRHGTAECLEGLAAVAVSVGDASRAARLLGAARRIRDSIGVPVPASDFAAVEQALQTARAGLSETAFHAALDEGGPMSRLQAIAHGISAPAT